MYVSLDEFEKGLKALLNMRHQRLAWLALGQRGSVSTFFARRKRQELDRAASEVNLTFEQVRAMADDIEDVIGAVAAAVDIDKFAERRSGPRPAYPSAEPEDADRARAKYRIVEEAVPADELQQRAWIKDTSKTHLFHGLGWETVIKQGDAVVSRPSGKAQHVALLRVMAETTHGYLPEYPEVLMTLDEEEIDYMLYMLTELRAELTGADD